MGNSLGGKKKMAKVMKVDGTTVKLKPPAQATQALRDHPGHTLLDAEEVKRLGLRARPLDPDAHLKPGKLYFMVELPRLPDCRAPRRASSGALRVSAKERLESLRLARRSMSDLAIATPAPPSVEAEEVTDGTVRLKMRLPKAQVQRLMRESMDAPTPRRRSCIFVLETTVVARRPRRSQQRQLWTPDARRRERGFLRSHSQPSKLPNFHVTSPLQVNVEATESPDLVDLSEKKRREEERELWVQHAKLPTVSSSPQS